MTLNFCSSFLNIQIRSKSEIRFALRSRSKLLEQAGALSDPSAKILSRLEQVLKHETGVWGAFIPLKLEPQIVELYSKLPHIKFVFPRVDGARMDFYEMRLEDLKTKFQNREPKELIQPEATQNYWAPEQIKGLLIPGQAFDKWGQRLGRGRGHYDRYLKRYRAQNHMGKCWGVAFSHSVLPNKLRTQHHDQKVDRIITDQKVIYVRNFERKII